MNVMLTNLLMLMDCPAQYHYHTTGRRVSSVSEHRLYFIAVKEACLKLIRDGGDARKIWASSASSRMKKIKSSPSYGLQLPKGMKVVSKMERLLGDTKVVSGLDVKPITVDSGTVYVNVPLTIRADKLTHVIFDEEVPVNHPEERNWVWPEYAAMRILRKPWAVFSLYDGRLSSVRSDGHRRSDELLLDSLIRYAMYVDENGYFPRFTPRCNSCLHRGPCKLEYQTKNRKKRGRLQTRSK